MDQDGSWKTPALRQEIRNKMEEAMKQSESKVNRSATDFENQLMSMAKSKVEYLQLSAKFIQCLKDNSKKQQQQAPQNQSMNNQKMISNPNQPPSNASIKTMHTAPDPIGALQNMTFAPNSDTNQGNIIQMVPISNVPDTVTLIGPATISSAPLSIQMTSVGHVTQMQSGQLTMHTVGQNTNQGSIQIQQIMPSNQQMRQIAPGVQPPMQRMPMQNQRMMNQQQMMMQNNHTQVQMQPNYANTVAPTGNNQNPRQQMQMQQIQQRPRQPGPNQMPMQQGGSNMMDVPMYPQGQPLAGQIRPGGNPGGFSGPGQPQQFQSQNMVMNSQRRPPPPNVSPMQHQSNMNQMPPSPANYGPSPGSQSGMVSSPMSVNSVGSINPRTPNPMSVHSSPLHTPMMVSHSSPVGKQMADEQAYLDKIRQLQRFTEPLRAKIDRIDPKSKELSKIRNLFSIISEPNKRVPMDVLLTCEAILEKMDFGKSVSSSGVMPKHEQQQSIERHPIAELNPLVIPTLPKGQELNMGQPLIDIIANNIKKPCFNHTLRRIFAPAVTALSNNIFRSVSPPPKKRFTQDEGDIPEVIQGEISRLDQKFKVQLDPLQYEFSKTLHIICRLDDHDLPCVPPISLKILESYPMSPPQCFPEEEYDTSPTWRKIKESFENDLSKLKNIYSITTLLNRWEMCVRQVCNKEQMSSA